MYFYLRGTHPHEVIPLVGTVGREGGILGVNSREETIHRDFTGVCLNVSLVIILVIGTLSAKKTG